MEVLYCGILYYAAQGHSSFPFFRRNPHSKGPHFINNCSLLGLKSLLSTFTYTQDPPLKLRGRYELNFIWHTITIFCCEF